MNTISISKLKTMFAALFASLFIFGSTEVSAATLYATTVNNRLVSFDSEDACAINSTVSISGLQEGEDILGIDFRPSNGLLYSLGSTSRIYTIDLASGAATMVGSGPLSTLLEGDSFGFDFNPRANLEVGAIRIVSNTGQNLRIHPDTLVVAVDGDLAYAMSDSNSGEIPSVVAAAYTNSLPGLTGTTLFDIDSGLDLLATQNPPNAGTLLTNGSLGINANDVAGFDIQTNATRNSTTMMITSVTNTAFAALKESGQTKDKENRCGNSSLVSVNLMTGDTTSLGYIGTKQPIRGLASVLGAITNVTQ